jgi:alpha-beta hydrolase superfamily lysophospholipase
MGSSGGEALRLLPTVSALHMPSLVIEYRNDRDAPGGQSTRYAYGKTEWEDLEAAVRYAQDAGAKHVVLVGYSMGGGIVMSFMQRSQLASEVVGLILDAPMLDFGPTVVHGLREGGVPGWFTGPPRWVAALRYDIDWEATDYLRDIEGLQVPVLLFHTTEDNVVPVSTSDRLAAARPDLVTYKRSEGPGHVRSWNLHPAEYETDVRAFLGKLGIQ